MAKLALLFQRRPALLVALLAVAALVGGKFGLGNHGGFGLWDGPI